MADFYLYHELQEAGLCAVHCLNAVMQGPVFNEIDLMHVSHDLDRRERDLMMAAGMESASFVKFVAEDSHNVSEDGNFSVQVIQKVLEFHGLSCHPLATFPEVRHNASGETAFVCNLLSHWFALRKVCGAWFNCNSLLPKPTYLSDFYLLEYIGELELQGYSVFVVRGELPECATPPPSGSPMQQGDGCWHRVVFGVDGPCIMDTPRAARKKAQAPATATAARRGASDEDYQLQLAMAMSLSAAEGGSEAPAGQAGGGASREEAQPPSPPPLDAELERAIALSRVQK
eukprot:m51a1_g626 hypothetical protein (287) ;mRNA; f:134383-135610